METDRVREGISKGFRSAELERVAPGGVGVVKPRYHIHLNKFFLHTTPFPQRRPLLLMRASAPC
jgi:hypothetical protein